MTDALKAELEEIEADAVKKKEEAETTTDEAPEEEPEDKEDATNDVEDAEPADETDDEKLQNEEAEKLQRQEAYRDRQRKKAEDEQAKADEAAAKAVDAPQSPAPQADPYAEVQQYIRTQKFEQAVNTAEKELIELEKPFKEAFTDYDDIVSSAIELTKMRLVKDGMTETEADSHLRREKVLVADRAVAQGLDPVEAVYNEGKAILDVFDAYAEKRGYKKGTPKTNLQAMREISKPNAMTGGAGKGAKAGNTTFDELGDDDLEEIHNTTIWDTK